MLVFTVSPPTSPTLYSENSCLFQWDPQVYQSGAHRCAHQLLTALSKNFGKDTFTANSNAKGGRLPLPGAMQSLLLKSEEISDALEEVCYLIRPCFISVTIALLCLCVIVVQSCRFV